MKRVYTPPQPNKQSRKPNKKSGSSPQKKAQIPPRKSTSGPLGSDPAACAKYLQEAADAALRASRMLEAGDELCECCGQVAHVDHDQWAASQRLKRIDKSLREVRALVLGTNTTHGESK